MSCLSNKTTTLRLLLVLFIDGLGQGIIFPILTTTVSQLDSTVFFNSETTPWARNLWYGLLIGIYYFMWFISAPVLGHWSDVVGRKKALLYCLSLAAMSFFISSIALGTGSLFLLLLGRFLGGVTSGDQAIAKAAILDRCPVEKQSIYLGWMLLAVILGLILGPCVGAIFQNTSLITWFTIQTPLYFAGALSIFNIILLWIFFREQNTCNTKSHIQWLKAPMLFIEAIQYIRIRYLLMSYCLTQLAWQLFYIVTSDVLIKKFHFSTTNVGIMLAMIGVGIGVGLGVLPYIVKSFHAKTVAIVSYTGLLIGIMIFAIVHDPKLFWISVVPTAACFGLAVSQVLPMFAKSVPKERQGWIMGITGAIVALTGGVSACIAGVLLSIHMDFPYLLAVLLMVVGLVFFIRHKEEFC